MPLKGDQTRTKILDIAKSLVMQKGFGGTSIDDIVAEAKLTKSAFFHHFKGKAELAKELVERNAINDLAMLEATVAEAESATDDPLMQMILFLGKFEEYISNSEDPSPGCMYAVYTYESMQFEPSVREFVADTLRRWTSIYVRKYQQVIDHYPPKIPVSANELAELTVSIVEGGLVQQRAYGDVRVTKRQSLQLRNYLFLLFGEPRARAA